MTLKKKINILFIIDTLCHVGGTERHLSHLVVNLPKDLFNCSVVAFDITQNILVDKMINSGIQITHIPVGREYTPNALIGAMTLSRTISAVKADIVQTFHQKSDTFGALVAKLSKVNYLISSKRDMGQYRKAHHVALNRAFRNFFDKVIVVADAVGDMIAEKEGVSHSRIVKIYNGVDTADFMPPSESEKLAAKARFGFNADDFVIGMVANFREEKNHNVFFEGILNAMKKIPALKALAVGGGPLLEGFRGRLRDHKNRFILPGSVKDVSAYLHAMDIACLIPGKNEGFSNSVLEKMAVGLPVIVTDVGGNAEAVIAGENGLVIEPNDTDSFVNAVLTLYYDPSMRMRMGQKSREFAVTKFSLDAMCKNHEALYLSLVEQRVNL